MAGHGITEIQGAKLQIPRSRFPFIAEILKTVPTDARNTFLSNRCDRDFLESYLLDNDPNQFIPTHGFLYAVSETSVLARLYGLGILPEEIRLRFSDVAKKLALEIFDFSFYNIDSIRNLLTEQERDDIIHSFADEGLPNIRNEIYHVASNIREDDDPDSEFEPLREALTILRDEFGDVYADKIRIAEAAIKSAVEQIIEDRAEPEPDWDDERGSGARFEDDMGERDIFDDVDK